MNVNNFSFIYVHINIYALNNFFALIYFYIHLYMHYMTKYLTICTLDIMISKSLHICKYY